MNFYLISLGCAKNLVDSESLAQRLIRYGYHHTADIGSSSLVIINTCGFIGDAKKESIETIFSVHQEAPAGSRIVVFGCLVQRYLRDLKELMPEVSLFLPVLPPETIAKHIMRNYPPADAEHKPRQPQIRFTPPSYAYVKIADGCRNRCSYCTIPLIRGPLRSVSIGQIVKKIKQALKNGVFEINLIAQDTTSYGIDLYNKPSLDTLMMSILQLKADFWLRLLYAHPARINKRLLQIISSDSRIVKYLDIPIQHISQHILKSMNRGYTKKLIEERIDLIRTWVPSISLRTTLMVGFPNESEEDFQELVDFLNDSQLDHVGVFEYSPEEDTPAFLLRPRIPSRVKTKRKRILMAQQKAIVRSKNRTLVGKTLPCIPDLPIDQEHGVWTGRISSQAPEVDGVVLLEGYEKSKGRIIHANIKGFRNYDLIAECAG